MKQDYDLIIGLDRSDKTASLHIYNTHIGTHQEDTLDTSPENMEIWITSLLEDNPKLRIALCLEQPASNLIYFFCQYKFITIYALNPITLKNYRETFLPSRAKDDPIDAHFLCELVLHHADKLRIWQPLDPESRFIHNLVQARRQVVDHRKSLTNRLQSILKNVFPQVLDLVCEDLWRPLTTDFLLKWPTLEKLKKSKEQTIRKFYYAHRSRGEDLMKKRLEIISNAVPITEDPVQLIPAEISIVGLVKEIEAATATINKFDKEIKTAVQAHPDAHIFQSFPGAGDQLVPRLIAAWGQDRSRYEDSLEVSCYSGVSPIRKKSGNTRYVHRRYCCPKFLRQSFHEYADQSRKYSAWAKAYYEYHRAHGKKHHTVVRSLAFKWIRIMYQCWKNAEQYNEERYIQALHRSHSHLCKLL